MTTQTHVWIHAQNGISDDEARRVLTELREKPFGPVELWRSEAPGDSRTLFLSFDGDVKQPVEQRLAEMTSLHFNVEVMARQDL